MAPAPFTAQPFTVQDLIDAVHAAVDAENLACEHPTRTAALLVADATWSEEYDDTARGALSFTPADPSGTVDVVLERDGSWSLWSRDDLRFVQDHVPGTLAECVEACLDALSDLGVL